MANEQIQNGKGEHQIDETTYVKGVYSKYVHKRKGGRGLKNWSKDAHVFPLDGTHVVAVRGLIHQEVPTRVRERGELN